MSHLVPKVKFKDFVRKSNKIIIAIIFAIISMILSYASIYEESTTDIREFLISTENFYEKNIIDFRDVPISVTYTQIIVNATFESGSGVIQVEIKDINGSVHKKVFEYISNKKFTLLSLEKGTSELSSVKVIINAYEPTKGKITLSMRGVAQPYYYLSIIAIPIVILAIVLFGIGMYESFSKIREEQKIHKMRWK